MARTGRIILAAVALLVPAGLSQAQAAPEAPAAAESLKVMSWNMWHGGSQVTDGRAKQLAVIEKHAPDVIALQETSSDNAKWLGEQLGWDYYQAGADLGFVSRHPITWKSPKPNSGAAGAGVRVTTPGGQEVEIWNAHLGYTPYGPYDACYDGMTNDELMAREEQSGRTPQAQALAKKLESKIAAADSVPVLLTGDFNTPSHLDWTAATKASHCGYEVQWPVTKIFEEAGLKDSFRVANPDPGAVPGNTWSPVYPKHEGSTGDPEPQDRIDFVDYAGSKLQVTDSRTIVEGDPAPVPDHGGNAWPSDHAGVMTTFGVTP
ncbi:endonuclease/exonuclease/phosphatase family protein [Streptomyces sp. A7024]|uniref:Endonuclease/exonuclease/phosphatase family protein n=1 Tax=Streptomyces coryli TaxID=1128680 RepID=A0A6G4U5G2_9ACTN|nr:endonuclease/exonuclease/phosphatase family protein [Streptomyces coryli]NGN66527.1 endonuclease/exonuclease/phosphatase family protein [Streptomyces coryli]